MMSPLLFTEARLAIRSLIIASLSFNFCCAGLSRVLAVVSAALLVAVVMAGLVVVAVVSAVLLVAVDAVSAIVIVVVVVACVVFGEFWINFENISIIFNGLLSRVLSSLKVLINF